MAGPIDATSTSPRPTDTELAATVEAVSPGGDSVPLSSGALSVGSGPWTRAGSWTTARGHMLLPVHPLTQARTVVPGQVTRKDIAIFPTMAELPAGWRLRSRSRRETRRTSSPP